MAIVAYYVVPDEQWLSRRSIARVLDVASGKVVDSAELDTKEE